MAASLMRTSLSTWWHIRHIRESMQERFTMRWMRQDDTHIHVSHTQPTTPPPPKESARNLRLKQGVFARKKKHDFGKKGYFVIRAIFFFAVTACDKTIVGSCNFFSR